MSLLELKNADEQAKSVAAHYETSEDRKEIYIKYLILSALKERSELISTEDSLFLGRNFYSQTRLFDFYVGNNLFDLIVLKPDSDELLFGLPRDEFHSNIYGYVVARIDESLEKAEILGYFESKDFEKVVDDNTVNTTQLAQIENFANIEILDSQMTLEDVSDRFFGLLSEFFDDTISDEDFSELACLMYNSAELREVYSQIGRFDKICSALKDNQDLLRDDLLTILAGNKDENEPDDGDIYGLEDLDMTDEDETVPIESPEMIEENFQESDVTDLESLGEESDLETLTEFAESEELSGIDDEQVQEHKPENDLGDLLELPQEGELIEPDSAETIESAFDETLNDTEEELVLAEIEEEPIDDLQDSNEAVMHIELDETEPSVAEEDLEAVGIENTENAEDAFILTQDEETLDEPELVQSEEFLLENISDTSAELEGQEAENEPELELEDTQSFDIPESNFELVEQSQDESQEEEQIEPQVNAAPMSKLAQELAALSSHKDDEVSDSELESGVVGPAAKEIEISDELMQILNRRDDDEPVVVNDEEIMAILGADTNLQVPEVNVVSAQKEKNENGNTDNDEDGLVSFDELDELSENEGADAQPDLEVLYNAENSATAGVFPGVGIVGSSKEKLKGISINKRVAVTAAVVAVLALAGISSLFSNKNNTDTDMTANVADNTDNGSLADMNMPSSMNTPSTPAEPVALPVVNNSAADSKIVTSLSKQSGAAPVILKSVAWQVPASVSGDVVFSKYLQIAGKNIKLNLATDLLETDDFAYNNKIRVSMKVKNNTPVKDIKVVESSGSKSVDEVVLQSIKQTLKYVNSPVMSSDVGVREVILVISI